MTTLPEVSSSERYDVVTVNENFQSVSAAAAFGIDWENTASLTLGIFGGVLPDASTVAPTTKALTGSQTNYVERTAAGVVTVNTSSYTAGLIPMFRIVTNANGITSYTDDRSFLVPGTGVTGPSSATDNAVARWDGTTGKLLQDGVVTISDTGVVAGVTNLTVATGTITDSAPITYTQTWNDGTEQFTGATFNITDTASLNNSFLVRWQVGGSDLVHIGKGGSAAGVFGVDRVLSTSASQIANAALTTFPATATTTVEGYRATATLSDGGGVTYAQVVGFRVNNAVKNGASDTVTKQVGFRVDATFNTGVVNYGFEGAINVSGTTRYNLFMSGTAPNHMAGQVFMGHTASVTTGQANFLQVSGSGSQTGGIGLNRYSADAVATRLEFAKSRNATIGSNTIAASGDEVMNINALGANGTGYDICAQIIAEIAGTPGASADMPGRLRFLITADGSATPSERLWLEPDAAILQHFVRVSGTSYSRLAIRWASTTLASVSGATVTATSLIPAKAQVIGVNTKVTVALGTGGGTTGYQVGDGTDADLWGNVTGTGVATATGGSDATANPAGTWSTAARNVVVTANGGNFNGTGSIRVDVCYWFTEAD